MLLIVVESAGELPPYEGIWVPASGVGWNGHLISCAALIVFQVARNSICPPAFELFMRG